MLPNAIRIHDSAGCVAEGNSFVNCGVSVGGSAQFVARDNRFVVTADGLRAFLSIPHLSPVGQKISDAQLEEAVRIAASQPDRVKAVEAIAAVFGALNDAAELADRIWSFIHAL